MNEENVYRPPEVSPQTGIAYNAVARGGRVWVFAGESSVGLLRRSDPRRISHKEALRLASHINCGAVGPEDGFGGGWRIAQDAPPLRRAEARW